MTETARSMALLASLLISVTPVHAQTQASMNAQARSEFEKADTELNNTYEALLNKLPDAEGKQKLKASVDRWLPQFATRPWHNSLNSELNS